MVQSSLNITVKKSVARLFDDIKQIEYGMMEGVFLDDRDEDTATLEVTSKFFSLIGILKEGKTVKTLTIHDGEPVYVEVLYPSSSGFSAVQKIKL